MVIDIIAPGWPGNLPGRDSHVPGLSGQLGIEFTMGAGV